MIDTLVLVITICAVVAALLFAIQLYRGRGIVGELVFADNDEVDCPVLVSHRYRLNGRPDALFKTKKGLVPVERKTRNAPKGGPYAADVIQAMTYAVLVEETFGEVPQFVQIEYRDKSFDLAYTPKRKAEVLAVTERLRAAMRAGDCRRSHDQAFKCRNCGHRQKCGQALG